MFFWDGFLKKASEERKEVSTVALIFDGKMLMGKRQDNGRWTHPGGHLEPDESPEAGAIREVKEEAGVEISPEDLVHLRSEKVTTHTGKKYLIHAYKAELKKMPTTSMKEDPDNEVHRWHWVSMPLKKEIEENLHSPKNILLRGLGLQKEARVAFRRFEREFKDQFQKVLEQGGQEYVKRTEGPTA